MSNHARCSFGKCMDTRVQKKRSVNAHQTIVWKMQKSNKTKTASRNCQIYDITRIHDRHNSSSNSNNQQPRTITLYTMCINGSFYPIFLFQLIPAKNVRRLCVRKEREYKRTALTKQSYHAGSVFPSS